jgi:hypothetical protein
VQVSIGTHRHGLIDSDGQLAVAFEFLKLAENVRLAPIFRAVGHVLHAGHAVGSSVAHRCFHPVILFFGRERRHDALDERSSRILKNSGWITFFVALDFASRNMLGIAINSGEFQGEGVG